MTLTPRKPPATKSAGATWLKREAELEEALITATCMVRDLAMDWPIDELCSTPEQVMETLDRLVPRHEVEPLHG